MNHTHLFNAACMTRLSGVLWTVFGFLPGIVNAQVNRTLNPYSLGVHLRRYFSIMLSIGSVLLFCSGNAGYAQDFHDDFSSSVVDPGWRIEPGFGRLSLTDNPGHL